MRSHHWNCSKFADWLRGTKKPSAETWEGWSKWNKVASAEHPVRYWLADEGLDYLQKVVFYVPDKLYAVKYYINNRWITKTHSLTAHSRDIKPGDWCDVGNRFLPCLFNELVDFVEIELAWWNIAWSDEGRKKYDAPFYAKGWFRWRTWRCKQSGIDNLDWQRTLKFDEQWMKPTDKNFGKPTPQAINAQEILDLYTWWTVTRPARIDAYIVSGWSEYCDSSREDDAGWLSKDKTPAQRKQGNTASKSLRKIEAEYEKEDEQMMIRLIRVRNSLWT